MKRVVAVVALLLLPLAAHAQASGWTPPQQIQAATTSNWFPSIAVDGAGTVHLVWSSGTSDGTQGNDLLMYAQQTNGTWPQGNDVILTGTGGWAARSSVVTDRTGRLHMLVRNRDYIYYTSANSADAASAHGWAPLHAISGGGQPYYTALAIDEHDTLHAVWQELSPRTVQQGCNGCSDLWYRRSANNGATWSEPIIIVQGQAGVVKPQLAAHGDALYVVWDEGKDPNAANGLPRGVGFTRSADGGRTWATPEQITDGTPQQAALGIDGKGTLINVFRTTTGGDNIVFRTSGDGGATWATPQRLPNLIARNWNDTPWDHYAMATDSAGNVHLLLVARRNDEERVPGLYHLTWNNDSRQWSAPDLVVNNDLYPEWPQVVVGNGNQLQLAWFTRSEQDLHDADNQRYQVWYSTRTVSAPLVQASLAPTPAPSAAATPSPQAVPTPVVPLAPDVAAAPLPTTVRSEAPLLRHVSMALVPVGALCVLALLFAARRRLT